MNVVSLFNGCGTAGLVLKQLGVPVNLHFVSEIDKKANQVNMFHHPESVQLGDVCSIQPGLLPKINLLAGGSPCQSFSGLGQMEGFAGSSGLFYEFVRVLGSTKPDYFLFENVVPRKKEWINEISKHLGVQPIVIDALEINPVSRPRMYWTNLPYSPEMVVGRSVSNFLLEPDRSRLIESDKWHEYYSRKGEFLRKKRYITLNDEPAMCFVRRMYGNWNGHYISVGSRFSRLSVSECANLMGYPVDYFSCVAPPAGYAQIGNGWFVPVIRNFFRNLL